MFSLKKFRRWPMLAWIPLVLLVLMPLGGCGESPPRPPPPPPPQLPDDQYDQKVIGTNWEILHDDKILLEMRAYPGKIQIFGLRKPYRCGTSTCYQLPDIKVSGPGSIFHVSDARHIVAGEGVVLYASNVALVKAHSNSEIHCLSCRVIRARKDAVLIDTPPITKVIRVEADPPTVQASP